MSDEILFEEIIEPGATWSHVLKRGTALRLIDTLGGANVGAMFFNFDCPTERLNIPDSLKAQHIARLTTGNVLYTDMGRVLISVIEDTVGRKHDPLGGHSTEESVFAKYGPATYQDCRNDYHRNAHDEFQVELAKWGLVPADLSPNVNFFSKVTVDESGAMAFVPNHFQPGSSVMLRAEMNVLAILNTLKPSTQWIHRQTTLPNRLLSKCAKLTLPALMILAASHALRTSVDLFSPSATLFEEIL